MKHTGLAREGVGKREIVLCVAGVLAARFRGGKEAFRLREKGRARGKSFFTRPYEDREKKDLWTQGRRTPVGVGKG